MAAGVSDGAVIVDTGLNNAGLIKNSRQFKETVESLTTTVRRAGRQMAESAGGYVQTMSVARSAAKALAGDQKALSREIAKTEGALRRLEERQELSRRKFEAAKDEAIAEAARQFQDNNFGAESLPWENELQAAEQLAEDLNTKLQEVGETYGEFEDTAAFRNLNVEIEFQREKLAELQTQLSEMKADTGVPVQAAADATEALEQPVKVAEQELGRYMRLMSDWSATMQEDSWSDAVINDENAMLSITRYINTAIHKREEEYRNTVAAIDNAKAAAKAEMDIHQYIGGLIEKREQQYQGVVRQIEEAAAATETVEQESTATVRTMDELGASINTSAGGFLRVAAGAGRALVAIGKFAGGGAVRYLRTLASTAKNAGIQLAKMAGSAVKGGLKKVGGFLSNATRSLLSFHKTQGTTNAGMGISLKNLLRYGLGIRSLFALFNRLRSAAKDGLEAIAKRSPATRSALNGLKASLNALKGSLAAAFAPVFTAVAPALTTLVNMLTTAINVIGAFFAALTGQKTYQKAVAGLKATGSAASGASGKVTDLKRELAGFDHLEILGDKNSGSGGGGGSSGGSGLTYDTEQVGGGIADWVEQLKTLWAAQDYDGIGRVIAQGINSAFEKAKTLISWDNLGAKVTQAVNAVTGILNGLVDGIDWGLIGRTFGTGVNTLVKSINLLADGINWKKLGQKLAKGFNGLVKEVDWANVGTLLGQKFRAALLTISGFVTKADWVNLGAGMAKGVNALVKEIRKTINDVDWSTVGKKLGKGLTKLIGDINWKKLGSTAAKSMNGVVKSLRSAVESFKWGTAATSFAKLLNSLIKDFSWDGLVRLTTSSANRIIAALRTAVRKFDWSSAATSFAKLLNGLIKDFNWDGLVALATSSANRIIAALRTAVRKFDWTTAATSFADLLNGLIKDFDWDGLVDLATSSANRIIAALRTAVRKFDWSSAATSFADLLNGLIGNFDWDGLVDLATSSANRIIAALRTAVRKFEWGSAGTTFGNLLNGLINDFDWTTLGGTAADLIGGPLEALRNAVSTFDFGEAATSFSKTVNEFFKNKKLWEDLGTVVSDGIKGLFVWSKDFLENLNAKQIAEDIRAFFGSIDWDGIAKTIWNAGITAMRKLGNFVLALIFGPDYKEQTKVQQQIEDYYSGLSLEPPDGRNFEVNFGLNLYNDGEMDAFDKLWKSIEDGLKTGNWSVPVGLDVPQESVDAAYQEFVKEWNLTHPEAPIDPTLPPEVGARIAQEWAQKKPELDAPVGLSKSGWSNVSDWVRLFMGAAQVAQNVGLARSAWSTVSNWVSGLMGSTSISQNVGLARNAWSTVSAWVGGLMGNTSIKQDVGLKKLDWASVSKWVSGLMGSTSVKQDVGLKKLDWSSVSKWVGGLMGSASVKQEVGLKKLDWSSVSKWVSGLMGSTSVKQDVGLKKLDWSSVSKWVSGLMGNTSVKQGVDLKKDGWSTVGGKFGSSLTSTTTYVSLSKNGTNWSSGILQWVTGNSQGRLDLMINFAASAGTALKAALRLIGINLASGGVISSTGKLMRFASGGMITGGGRPNWWSSVQKYASGTSRAHGTLFAAGEAGPEIIGHINGRTEILNKSQLAQTMYSAVSAGMLAALSKVRFRMPAMATGAVLPYEIAAQIAQTGAAIEDTLNANNEDLIQVIISTIGAQTSALVAALQALRAGGEGGVSAQQIINEINRRTQMFGASPLQGV